MLKVESFTLIQEEQQKRRATNRHRSIVIGL